MSLSPLKWGSGVLSVLFTAVPIHMNETDSVPGIPPNVPCPPSWEGVHFGSCCCPALATPGTSQEPDWLPLSSSPREGEPRLILLEMEGGFLSALLQRETRPEPGLFSQLAPPPLWSSCHHFSPGLLQQPPLGSSNQPGPSS